MQKLLEGANVKLATVATDVLGVSGRQMLEALVAGTTDPQALAALAKGKLRRKQALEQALAGLVGRTSASCCASSWATSTTWTPASPA